MCCNVWTGPVRADQIGLPVCVVHKQQCAVLHMLLMVDELPQLGAAVEVPHLQFTGVAASQQATLLHLHGHTGSVTGPESECGRVCLFLECNLAQVSPMAKCIHLCFQSRMSDGSHLPFHPGQVKEQTEKCVYVGRGQGGHSLM